MMFKSIILFISVHQSLSNLVVELPKGRIRGRQEISLNRNVSFYAFQQIPYAEPPLGKLRFMPPKPVEKWDGILNCTENTKVCYQLNHDEEYETEDCLYLNVYTPVEPGSNSSLPVMFYIFGGGFREGNATFNNNGPHFFMEEGVVVVTILYRVGPFGFLSTMDEVVSGNGGLKDQNLALKWVQENIEFFGGDPNKVTIFGQSAGAASVSYQILSKQSAGLFRGAIALSGSAICPWAYQRYPHFMAYRLASSVDPNFDLNSTSEELVELLQSVDGSVLDQISGGLYYDEDIRYGPVVEPDVEDAFLTELMFESIEEGNFNEVSTIFGITSEEELRRLENGIDSFREFIEPFDKDPALLVQLDFHIENITERRLVGNLSREIYTDGLFADNLAEAIRYISDDRFSRPIIRHANLHSKFADVYFYQFSYHGKLGQNDLYIEGAERVEHAEDLQYLWASNNVSNIADYYPESDVTTLERYVRLFTNFAKYLNPTPEPDDLLQNITWPKFVANNSQYLNINNSLEIEINPKDEPYRKWVDLYDNYAIRPYDTY